MDDKRLDRIEDKLDKVLEKAASTDVTLAKQSVILDEHIRRTALLEAKIDPIEAHVDKIEGALETVKKIGAILLKIALPLIVGAGGTHGVLHYLMKLY